MASADLSRYINRLLSAQPLREPILKCMVQSMQLPACSMGLDIGCGTGLNTWMLAEALGPGGQVVGLDVEAEFLIAAGTLIRQSDVKDRMIFKRGDAASIPFPDRTFDWACSVDCVGAVEADPVKLLQEIKRVTKPGGRVFVALWSSQKLLPGYPLVEAQLNTSSAALAPFKVGMEPGRHIMRGLDWFEQAGFQENKVQTLVRDICPPISTEVKIALQDLLHMRWEGAENEVHPELWQDYLRLCNPNSPDFILDAPGYCGFFTYSVFSGLVV